MRNNQTALSTLIAAASAVQKLAQIISSIDTPEPVCLKATRLLAVLASTQETARQQVTRTKEFCIYVLAMQTMAAMTPSAAYIAYISMSHPCMLVCCRLCSVVVFLCFFSSWLQGHPSRHVLQLRR